MVEKPDLSELAKKYKANEETDSDDENYIQHYGTKRHSGRYPWGSGENPFQRSGDFLARVDELKKELKNDTEVAKALGLSTTMYRVQYALAQDERRSLLVEQAKSLQSDGKSLNEIAEIMGFKNNSSVRNLLSDNYESKMKAAQATADYIKEQIDKNGLIDVGAGTEKYMNISKEKFNQALYLLEREGYEVFGAGVPQQNNPGKQINLKVIGPPGTEYKEIYNFGDIHPLDNVISYDNGETFKPAFAYPESLNSDRLYVRYPKDGGDKKDGVIELRRGVEDLSLGTSNYAQVRIMVDGTHYIKGMAVYGDDKDFPPGKDIIFNTSKPDDYPIKGDKKKSVLKPIKDDPENPFGSNLREHGGQYYYIGEDGKEHLSPLNKTRHEEDWEDWSKKLPSQFLSKQPLELAKRQLNLTKAEKREELEEILALTNPTVKKNLLYSYAEDCESAAETLQAVALPRQRYQVLLPINSLSKNEVYAPNFNDGEQVALIRFPHGGRFEIPILTVNNANKEGAKVLTKSAKDAVGINSEVAKQLSGADFDGDTVMVIPLSKTVNVASKKYYKDLANFDPHMEYGPSSYEGRKIKNMTKANTQLEMGKISNLITDMTLLGATDEEITRAVKHSMVVIDAEKHKLDYKKSEKDNKIQELKEKYQAHVGPDGKIHYGAATIISRAKSPENVDKRQGQYKIDEEGNISYKPADDLKYTKEKINKRTGEVTVEERTRTQKSTKMAETKDAYSLVSEKRNPMELLYADYANYMKYLAQTARKEYLATEKIKYDPKAAKEYADEVRYLNTQLFEAEKNAPKERMAQILAKSVVDAKIKDNPDLKGDKGELRKIGQKALQNARIRVGAQRHTINWTDKGWEAAQKGAISDTLLKRLLNHSDAEEIRKRATPKNTNNLSATKINMIKAMSRSGYTNADIAERFALSPATIIKVLGE